MFQVLILALIPITSALQAYDCDLPTKQRKALRLDRVAPCEPLETGITSEESVRVQVIQSLVRDTVKVRECILDQTVDTGFCGYTDSIAYGIAEELETLKPYIISQDECRKLIEKQSINFHGKERIVDNLNRIDLKHFIHGNRSDDGKCTRGEAFDYRGRHFTKGHYLRATLTGRVVEKTATLLEGSRRLLINGAEVNYLGNGFSDSLSTYVWEATTPNCSSTILEVWRGEGRKFNHKSGDSVVIVKDQDKEIFAGFQLKGKEVLCNNHEVYKTQVSSFYLTVVEHKGTDITRAEESFANVKRGKNYKAVDALENLHLLNAYNLVTQSNNMHESLKQVGDKVCQNERTNLEHQLELIRNDPETGIILALGYGHTAVVKGAVAYVYGCKQVDVTYRHIPEDSQFMPVLYGNKSVFLDTATLVLRDNTTYLPVNPEMPVQWIIAGQAHCKSGNQEKYLCPEAPEELKPDMEKIKEAIKYNPDEYALQGGIWKPEDLERARIENQRESAKNAAIDAVGTVIGQGEYGGQRLPPQSKTVDQIWGSFGSVSDYLGFLGLQFGWNWKSFIIVFSVISIAAMIINYQYMIVSNIRTASKLSNIMVIPCMMILSIPIPYLFYGMVWRLKRRNNSETEQTDNVEMGVVPSVPQQRMVQRRPINFLGDGSSDPSQQTRAEMMAIIMGTDHISAAEKLAV